MREIKLITAATKNSQIPQINMTQCDFLMCSDVLTDSVHLRRIWGNACHPRGTCKIQWAESTNLKKKKKRNSSHHLVGVRLTLPQSTFATAMSQSQ